MKFAAIAAAAVAGTVALLAAAVPALAASSTALHHSPAPGASFAVSPARMAISASRYPVRQILRVQDSGSVPIVLRAAIVAGHESRTGVSIFGKPGTDSGARWLRITPRRLRLEPGEIREVHVIITVPRHHAPGQRYLGVRFSETGHAEIGRTTEVVHGSIVAELVVSTTGKIRRSVGYSLAAPAVSFGGPVPLRLTIRNLGNVYVLSNSLAAGDGNATGSASPVRFPGVLALAGSTRVVSAADTDLPAYCFPCRLTGPGGSSAAIYRLAPLPAGGVVLMVAGLVLWLLRRRRGRGRPAAGGPAPLPLYVSHDGGPDQDVIA
jgi:hypothetical protein